MRRPILLLVGLLLAGCGDPRSGQLYRVERELWRADHRRAELPVISAGHAGLASLAGRYENIGRHYETSAGEDSLGRRIRALAGRAWVSAVDLHLARVDSLHAVMLLEDISARFDDRPQVLAEIAWRRGRIAQSYGEPTRAIEHYETVLSSLAPDPGATGVADSILYLPLWMVRLADAASADQDAAELDRQATEYYQEQAAADSFDVRTDAQMLLAELDLERGRWSQAAAGFDSLERRMAAFELARLDPAGLAERALEARRQGWLESQETLDGLWVHFEGLRQAYPDRSAVPRALRSLALAARDRGLVEDALRLLSRLRIRYGRSVVAADAMLDRARILDREARWREAYVEYRLLEAEHPLSYPGLQVPLEIVRHHRRRQDDSSARDALRRAEDRYRDILQRYPEGPHTDYTRERLTETLLGLGRFDEALAEILALAKGSSGTPRELALLVRAHRLASGDLEDPAAASAIVDRIVQRYPGTYVGRALFSSNGRAPGR